MMRKVTIKIWQCGEWYLGRAKEIPGALSQGRSLGEVLENVRDACCLMLKDGDDPGPGDAGVPSPMPRSPTLATSVELQLPGTQGESE
jgi:predicted RNase H-like HicB family nuclease